MNQITAYIAMGSNLGDREETLHRAVLLIGQLDGVEVLQLSHFYETLPVGGPPGQGKYLNGVVEVRTSLAPQDLLAGLHEVEQVLGRDRDREERWGSRTCDLDIVLFGDVVLDTPELTIPHPRMHQRRFVLEPLAEIAPGVTHPVLQKNVRQLLEELP